MGSQGPIGVFDSGVGGLSVLTEIRRQLPDEAVWYAADSAHAPYGDKPAEFITERAHAIAGFFVERGVKAVVVACNTATGIAVDALRARWPIPIVAIEPAIKPAVVTTQSGVVGVLATSRTLASERYARLARAYGAGVRIVPQACTGLVERIEAGDLDGPETLALVERYVRPLVEQGADTLVLGCTHYPFVRGAIESVVGPNVTVINPAAAVARELRRRLDDAGLRAGPPATGHARFWTSGDPARLRRILDTLGFEGTVEHLDR